MVSAEIRAAAQARMGSVAQRSHRPQQRRSAESATSGLAPVSFPTTLEVRDAATEGKVSFRGLASAYERPYEMYDAFGPYNEVMAHGAATRSLARPDLDVPLVLEHNSMRRIARTTNGTLSLRETPNGLEVEAPDLSMEDQDTAYIVPKLRSGLINEMSFGFRIIRCVWSPDYTECRVQEVDLHKGDVSIVSYGANPYTSASLRQQPTWRDLIPAKRQLHRLI